MPDKKQKRQKTPDEIREEVMRYALETLNTTLAERSATGVQFTPEACAEIVSDELTDRLLRGFDEMRVAYFQIINGLADLFAVLPLIKPGTMAGHLAARLVDQGDMMQAIHKRGLEIDEEPFGAIPRRDELTRRQWFIAYMDGLLPGDTPSYPKLGLEQPFTDTELGLIALAGGDVPKIEPGETVADVVNKMRRIMASERERARARIERGRERAPSKKGKQ